MKSSHPLTKSRGFTLLELVVVVAIIGLLASIALIPNLIRFQRRAQASNIKAAATQVATAYELAGTEGCTNFDVAAGGVVDCDAPFAQVYIQTLTPASGNLQYDFDLGAGGNQTSRNDLNPTTQAFDFNVVGFSGGQVFQCRSGSCACSVANGCTE